MHASDSQGGLRKGDHAGASRPGAGSADPLVDELQALRERADPGEMITELHEVKDQLLAAQASLEQCARDARGAATRAKRAERSRLAQMLHDGLQQVLVAATMRLDSSIRLLPTGAAKEAAVQARELLTEAIKVSRTLTSDLSPLHFVDEGLGPALIWLSDWFASHHGLKVAVDVATDAEPESEALRTLVFQGVREILFNAVKHAAIDKARVQMVRAEADVQVVIEDWGIGFQPALFEDKTDGFGLFSVKRRLEQLGGAMEVVSAPGAGTRVTLKAPLVQSGQDRAPNARG